MNQEMLTYYNDSGDKEWQRLESMWTDFFVNPTFMKRYLKPESRILDIGACGSFNSNLSSNGRVIHASAYWLPLKVIQIY